MAYSLDIAREIYVPREIVWDLWTQPEHLQQWYAPSAEWNSMKPSVMPPTPN